MDRAGIKSRSSLGRGSSGEPAPRLQSACNDSVSIYADKSPLRGPNGANGTRSSAQYMRRASKTKKPTPLHFYGYPVEVIQAWCCVSHQTACLYKSGARKPSKQALRLFELHRDGRVLGPERREWSVIKDRLATPEGREFTRGQLDAHMFKSLSCVGDMLMDERTEDGRRLSRAFVTFTYRPGVDWQPRHLTECLKRMRHWVERRGIRFRYLWVAEQHKSGRVHYHAIVWLPRGLTMPKPDKQGWWPHGFTNVQWARKGIGYLVKYATKTATSLVPFPRGCRLHGHGGLDRDRRVYRAWWMLPKYQRERCEPADRVCRARGGGWRSTVTGEWWESVAYRLGTWQLSALPT